MKVVIANLLLAFGFLRAKSVPEGCCHACEFCCMQECATKYAGTVTTEEEETGYGGPETLPEALAKVPPSGKLLQVSKMDKATFANFGRCLAQKAGCPKKGAEKKWDPKRKSVTVSCMKDAMAGKSFAQVGKEDPGSGEDPNEHLQGCVDHGVEYCHARKPAEVFETGMTLEECTEACLMTECGCPFS